MSKSISNTLSDSRVQLHWAAQVLSAAADATLEKADDDSHSNLGWDRKNSRIVGRVGASIDVVQFLLLHEGDSFQLHGSTLDSAMNWLGARLKTELKPRDYDMPEHEVADGCEFNPDSNDLVEISKWFGFGSSALEGHGDLRIWPHHFDLGFFMPNVATGDKSIGGGFSVGDNHYEMPYIYVNPYGVNKPESLPEIANGFWTEKWLGIVTTIKEFGAQDENGLAIASSFTNAAIETCKRMFN